MLASGELTELGTSRLVLDMFLKFGVGMKRFVCILLSLFVGFPVAVSGWVEHSNQPVLEKDKESASSENLVTELAPGKKLYGNESRYAEIGHTNMFDLSPDGKKIAFISHQGIRYWDIESGKLEKNEAKEGKQQHFSPGQHFAYSADGKKLFYTVWDHSQRPAEATPAEEGEDTPQPQPVRSMQVIEVRDAETNELQNTIIPVADEKGNNNNVNCMIVSPNGKHLFLGLGQRSAIYDVDTGELISKIKHNSWVQTAAFTHDGESIIDARGRIMNAETGEEDGRLPRMIFGGYSNTLVMHPKKNILVAAQWGKELTVYDLDEEERIELEKSKAAKGQHFLQAEFSPDGKLLVAATYLNQQNQKGEPHIVIWEFPSGKLINEIPFDGGYVARVRISPDNKFVYSKSHSQYGISRYEIEGRKNKSSARYSVNSPIKQFRFTEADEKVLVSPQQGNSLIVDLETGEPIQKISTQNTSFMEISDGGKYTVLAANYASIQIFNSSTGRSRTVQVKSYARPSLVSQLGGFLTRKKNTSQYENFAINSVTISDEGKHALVAQRGNQSFRWQRIRLDNGKMDGQERFKFSDYWDVEPRKEGQPFRHNAHQWQSGATAVSPNAQHLALIGAEQTIYVVDAETGDESFDFKVDSFDHSSQMFFSRDSEQLFVKSGKAIFSYDLESGEKSDVLDVSGGYHQFAFSQDRSKLATLGNNRKIVVYDLQSGEEVFSRKYEDNYVGIGVSDSGEKLALAKSNCQFEVWNLDELED